MSFRSAARARRCGACFRADPRARRIRAAARTRSMRDRGRDRGGAVRRQPAAFCDIAEWNGEPAGFAVWFFEFLHLRGPPRHLSRGSLRAPGVRGKGIGKALLVHLAKRCVDERLARLQWAVLDWNAPSIASTNRSAPDDGRVDALPHQRRRARETRKERAVIADRPRRRGRRERRDRRGTARCRGG